MEYRVFSKMLNIDDFDVEHYLLTFDENKLESYLQLFNLLEIKIHDHDGESVDLISEFLQAQGEKTLYPLAVYITDGFDVDDSIEHFGMIYNYLNQDQLKIVENYILEMINHSEIKNPLNLFAVEALIEEGISNKSAWVNGLNNVLAYSKQKLEYLISSDHVELKDFITYTSSAIFGMSYRFEKENFDSLTFNEWKNNNQELYNDYLIRTCDCHKSWVNRLIELLG